MKVRTAPALVVLYVKPVEREATRVDAASVAQEVLELWGQVEEPRQGSDPEWAVRADGDEPRPADRRHFAPGEPAVAGDVEEAGYGAAGHMQECSHDVVLLDELQERVEAEDAPDRAVSTGCD